MQAFFQNFLKFFQAAPESPEPPQKLFYRDSAAAVAATVAAAPTTTVVPAAAVIAAAGADGTGAGIPGRTTATEQNDEDQDDPQTTIATPATIVTPHKSEPPNQSWRPLSDLSSSYAASAGMCVIGIGSPGW